MFIATTSTSTYVTWDRIEVSIITDGGATVFRASLDQWDKYCGGFTSASLSGKAAGVYTFHPNPGRIFDVKAIKIGTAPTFDPVSPTDTFYNLPVRWIGFVIEFEMEFESYVQVFMWNYSSSALAYNFMGVVGLYP
jgi:hypothetical protein